ncbi:MAG TPA: UPF0182 family protein [Terriglobales bacterium]|nr:UPF0182 family protein [Terriglobales bacterium]
MQPDDWPPIRRPMHTSQPPHPPFVRRRWLWLVLGVIALIFFGGQSWLSYFVNSLWFGSLGYAEIFWKSLGLQWGIFAVSAVATFLFVYVTFLILKRTDFTAEPRGRTILLGGRAVKLPVESILRLVALAGSLFVAVTTAGVMMADWQTFALYFAAPRAAGLHDPIFGQPLNFYLFTLPAWELFAGWLLTLALLSCGIAGFFLLVNAGTRALEGYRNRYALVSWRGVSITSAFLLLVIAWQVYLARFDRLTQDHTIFSGVTYTDAHVILPGLLIVCIALLLGAAIAAANAVWWNRAGRLVVAVLPAATCYILLQISAWYVSTFIVGPNQLVREQPYIANNIQLTRQAFDLDEVSRQSFPADTTPAAADPANNQDTLENIRLWDWRALQDTLRQIQEIRTYYDFPDIDIDRYPVEGHLREVMLAARELNVDKLPESSRNWINDKLIYTHGYGVTMNPVNGFTAEGLPTLWPSNMPVQSTVPDLEVTRPEIYFGELTNTDVYVKTRQKEFNYPQGQANNFTEYEGSGGIVLGGWLRRVLIALDRGDISKLPFSDDVNAQSRLLMRRNVLQRVSALAPFLTFDPDPYIVVGEDGRLSWIVDAFTTSDSYPYSTHYALGDNSINYMRNSVKAVIDAYDGTTTFYVFDDKDPIVDAYRRLFPTLFQPAAAMPPGLRKHVRYPQMLLEMQAQVYCLYHMTDPEVFYNREDLWNVASEVALNQNGEQAPRTMQPSFILMKLPGESHVEFVGILPFTPANRNNLIGWIAARSDGDHYGTAVVYDFPKTRLIDGPLQIEARIDQNAQLSGQLTLWNQQGSHVRRGTLLVIPIGQTLLYAEPIYLQAEHSPMPELRLVVLALQDRLAYGPNFDSALAALFGNQPSTLEGTAANAPLATVPSASTGTQPTSTGALQPSAGTPPTGTPTSADDRNALIAEAAQDLADYQRLTAEGKLAEAGQKLQHLKTVLDRLNASAR